MPAFALVDSPDVCLDCKDEFGVFDPAMSDADVVEVLNELEKVGVVDDELDGKLEDEVV
jgi:hypothetical protein